MKYIVERIPRRKRHPNTILVKLKAIQYNDRRFNLLLTSVSFMTKISSDTTYVAPQLLLLLDLVSSPPVAVPGLSVSLEGCAA